jgi:hypothetical protein
LYINNEDFTPDSEHLQSLSLEECNCGSSFSPSDVIKYMYVSLHPPATEDKTLYYKGEKEGCDIKLSNYHNIYVLKFS